MATIGRPPEPVPEDIASALCVWISEGKTLRAFCRQPGMPARRTIDQWRRDDLAFHARVVIAREIGFEEMADECLDIADFTANDTIETEKGARMDSEWVSRSKLRVETRLRLLACWDPRRYGQKGEANTIVGEALAALVVQGVDRARMSTLGVPFTPAVTEIGTNGHGSSNGNGHTNGNGHP